jgi:PHD/YefM family antitoxin component YafN of YafNO toxin-antitoxin module
MSYLIAKNMANFKNLEKVLELTAKTGDKIIVISETHEPFVILALKEYQALMTHNTNLQELTEQELLEKINRDIAVWKASQEDLSTDYNLDQFKVEEKTKAPEPVPQVSQIFQKPADTPEYTPVVEEEEKYYVEPAD